MFRSMLPAVATLLAMLVYPFVMPATGNAETTFSAPVCEWTILTNDATGATLEAEFCTPATDVLECQEDAPCWRWWMGNRSAVASPETLYMWLPFGPQFDALAPLFGYRAD